MQLKDNNIIVGVVSHDKNIHDSKTLDASNFLPKQAQIPSTSSH
jgi:hypothetical protein